MTRIYDKTWMKTSVARDLSRLARLGTFDGTSASATYLDRCRGYHMTSGSLLIFTRDVEMHRCGWLKNPDYDRCLHLSLSFRDPGNRQLAPRDRILTREWVGLFFGDDRTKLWTEPPFSREGKEHETWHYRLFCNPDWSPLVPRGEVYTKDFTEKWWKSWSDVQAGLEGNCGAFGTYYTSTSYHSVRCSLPPGHDGDHSARTPDGAFYAWPRQGKT